MPLETRPFEEIGESDLQELIDIPVPEGKTIDYKRCLPGGTSEEKKEFYADVISFANASGGYLIYGMKEENRIPTDLCGLEIDSADDTLQRLENMIRDNIEPRIPGLAIKGIGLQNQKTATVIHVPRSWAGPHMIKTGDSRFFSRNSIGKYPLDVEQIRAAFVLSETIAERIRNFRAERISRIMSDEAPMVVTDTPKLIFHILPLMAFNTRFQANLTKLQRYKRDEVAPLVRSGWNPKFNADGYMTFTLDAKLKIYSYLQIFRNGCIEAVDSSRIFDNRCIHRLYEQILIDAIPRLTGVQKDLEVEPPVLIMLSFLGIKGYTLQGAFSHEGYPIDRDALLLPEAWMESFEDDPAEVMKPIFDSVWQAAGWSCSLNYDESGKWRKG